MKKCLQIISCIAALLLAAPRPATALSVAEMKVMEKQVQSLVAKNMPAVISLMGESQPGAGSGVIISADGLILTAAHVTRGNETMTVIFPDGRSAKCKVLGSNYSRDIGMAKIEGGGVHPFAEVGDSDMLVETSIVVAMGHPGGFDLRRTPPVRIGRINTKSMGGFLVSDCTLVGGDSGGPLFDIEGRVIGIHSSISESLGVNRHAPTAAAKADWDKLLAGERWGRLSGDSQGDPRRAVMGAVLDPESKDGVTLKEVQPRSPASEAGLKAGDVVTQFDGAEIKSLADLRAKLEKSKPGDSVALRYKRDGSEADAKLKLISEAQLMQRAERGDEQPRRRGRNRTPEPPANPENKN